MAPPPRLAEAAEPDPYFDGFTAAIIGRAITSAVTLGVIEALAEQPATGAGLADRLDLDPLGTDTLLTALHALGYVNLEDGEYRLSPVAERELVRSSPESIATFVGEQGDLHWEILTMLPEAIRTGRPYAMHEERRDRARWEAYIRGLFEASRGEHDANAALVPVEDPHRLVDVAGGHGAFAMAMCGRHPALQAEVLDLPPAVEVGRAIVDEQGFAGRVSFRAGDVFEVGLGEELDVVSAFNLVHHLPEDRNRELCRRARAALRPGGALVIGDSERPKAGQPQDQRGALSSLLFYTWSHGRNFTRDEIASWLEEAGFAEVRVHRNERSPWRIVVVGRAPR
jgi:2-polyprenyl-3-methyl-5-hydroxy-6-metoxy-1,4-benzoquinol methylase